MSRLSSQKTTTSKNTPLLPAHLSGRLGGGTYRLNDVGEALEAGRYFGTEMESQDATLAFDKYFKVSLCLELLQHTEGVLLTGDRNVLRVVASDL